MRKKHIRFMALGGGQRVGASCYYLGLGNSHLLLDCGIGVDKGIKYVPAINELVHIPGIQSLRQISQIFISHGHLDHAGYLPEVLKVIPDSKVYMTEITEKLLNHQYSLESYFDIMHYSKNTSPYLKESLRRVSRVNYCQGLPFKDYEVKFFPAGHIPGAMMTLIKYKNTNILYTGDFSLHNSIMTSGCILPEEKIDLLIMCGLHAKKGRREAKKYIADDFKSKLRKVLEAGKNIYCYVPQLSKGMELLKYLNTFIPENIKIFLDDFTHNVISEMETMNISIRNKNNYPLKADSDLSKQHIVIASKKGRQFFSGEYYPLRVDFSLHDTFEDNMWLVKKLNPKQAIIVHSPEPKEGAVATIEERLLCDTECQTQFIFPEEKELYLYTIC